MIRGACIDYTSKILAVVSQQLPHSNDQATLEVFDTERLFTGETVEPQRRIELPEGFSAESNSESPLWVTIGQDGICVLCLVNKGTESEYTQGILLAFS